MIHTTEAVIGVLDLTGWARQIAGPVSTLVCSFGFRVTVPVDNSLPSNWRSHQATHQLGIHSSTDITHNLKGG